MDRTKEKDRKFNINDILRSFRKKKSSNILNKVTEKYYLSVYKLE